MALYSREQTKSFFSEIAHEQDVCLYCEKAISEKLNTGKINRDEMHKELKLLKGKLTGKRVMKFRYVGHDFCICPECVSNINAEINPAPKEENPVPKEQEVVSDDSSAEATDVEPVTETVKPDSKGKGKGKSNASK